MSDPAQTSVLAFVTTLHCALLLLRKYRPRGKTPLVLLPSIAFVVSPWFLDTPLWLAGVFATHVAWFIACERLLPGTVPATPIAPRQVTATAPSATKSFISVPILAVLSETQDIRTFRMGRPGGFTFRAGQFVMVRVELDRRPVIRCYSISSSPACTGYLEISVRRQGAVSRHLHETLRPGAKLDVRGPGGAFVYPEGDRPIVLLAAGIGITPLLSMLRHALDAEPSRSVTLILSAKSAQHVPFRDELQGFVHRHPQFRLVIALSGGSSDARFHSGRIDRSLIESTVERVHASVYMICGPLLMIEDMKHLLESLGVPPSQIHFEKFEAAVAGAHAAATAEAPRITLRKGRKTIAVAGGQTILEAAESAGVSIPSMCRVGVCSTCKTRLLEGEVEGDFDAIDADEQAEGWILPCVARPVTECVLDA